MKPITADEIATLTQAGTPVICFDVREGFRHHQLDAGGWQMPFNEITKNAAVLLPYKDTLCVVCCMRPAGSGRTKKAARSLQALGFSDVRELKDGIYNGWVKKMKLAKMPGRPAPITDNR